MKFWPLRLKRFTWPPRTHFRLFSQSGIAPTRSLTIDLSDRGSHLRCRRLTDQAVSVLLHSRGSKACVDSRGHICDVLSPRFCRLTSFSNTVGRALANHNSTHDDRRKGQPSWGYLIVLALIAIVLLNLLAATILLLMQPTPERYWFLGSVWTVALIGLTQLPRLRRTMALQRTSPRR